MLVFEMYNISTEILILWVALWGITGISTALARIEIDETDSLNFESLLKYMAAAILITIFWPWVVWANLLRNKVLK